MFKKKWLVLLVIAGALSALLVGCGKSEEEKLLEELENVFGSSITTVEEGTPEATLQEIDNFITRDIWNKGFVDISWYINSGTSSTGATIDIDLTLERLGQSIEKKREYDTVINELGDDYAQIKDIWSKLSGEIDSLYEYASQNKPEAKSGDSGFDTGLFKQYSEAFGDDVAALIEKQQQ